MCLRTRRAQYTEGATVPDDEKESEIMTDLIRSAATGDTDPFYYVGAMVLTLAVVIAVLVIGSKRKK